MASQFLNKLVLPLALAAASCSGSGSDIGAAGAGGSGAAGDTMSGAGGTVATGGAPGSGGATGLGGLSGSGGGTAGSGGGAGAGPGGAPGVDSGAGRGGAAGSGGSPASVDSGAIADAAPTAGCGAATWPMGGTANPQMIDVANNGTTTARQFYFALPTNYASSRPYRVVFAWHYAGGTAVMVAGTGGGAGRYYGLQPLLADTIFITGQGLNDAQGRTGWPNTNGQDVAFARAMMDWLNANFCVDKGRIFSTGFSYGAIMSHTVACQMPDVFRAAGIMSGSLIGRANSCVNHPIAAWMTHGADDTSASGGVDFSAGVTARDRIVALNHCAATTQPTTPDPCVAYDGCDSGYPTVWCPREAPRTDTGHVIPSFAPAAIAAFFSQF